MKWVLVSVMVVCVAVPMLANAVDQKETSQASQSRIEAGKILHIQILDRHPQIDKFYRRPLLHAGLTDKPLAVICLPVSDWQTLTESERASICAYAANLVAAVKAKPFQYTQMPPTAPAASTLRGKVAKMTNDSYGILAGRISEDGRDILSDEVVRCGN
ncbi:MAG: hypothetical protein WAW37_05290 [Syntrophobacteraceae bacterium]